jgi:FtsH-binding integral membrane protein
LTPRPTGILNTAPLLGQVMILVSVTLGLTAVGARLGRGLSPGDGLVISLAVFGMLIIQAIGGRQFRVGYFAAAWLFATGLALGLGIGPTLTHYTATDPSAVTRAAITTALVVAAMGVGGLTLDRDLSSWMRPLTLVIFGLVVLSLVLFLIGDGGSPLLSLAVAGVSAVLILVDFNYLRRHGTEDDVVLLATGIFISVVNIFLSLLNVFSRDQT